MMFFQLISLNIQIQKLLQSINSIKQNFQHKERFKKNKLSSNMEKQRQSFQTEQNFFLMSFSNNNNKNLPNTNHSLQKKSRNFIEDHFDQNQQNTQKEKNNNNNSNKIPSEIVSLLQNCKVSIKSLQQQVALKNQQINKLSLENMKLSQKLIQAQKQVQRNHQMLALYMKDSENKGKVKQFHTVKEKSSQLDLNFKLENQSLKSQIEQQKQAIQQIKRQNQNLTFQNYHLKDEIRKLRSQINHLDSKVYKMGKGVGKALSTIKKSNINSAIKEDNPQIINMISLTENKQNSRYSINGKIVCKGKKQSQFFSAKKITFQTPSKKVINKSILPSTDEKYDSTTIDNSSLNNKKQQFTYKCQKKMEQISINAKRFDQIDKIQSLLNKMQQLSQFQQDSQEDLVE